MISMRREGDVFVLAMDDGENRFRPASVARWNALLDEVEQTEGPKALVTTGAGKFYSNGLDLDWMLGQAAPDEREAYIPSVLALMARVLTFPAITVCAINGHAFGAGGQIAVAHDYRVMREDRGYFCMPELDMGVPLHPGMTALLQARLPHQTAHRVIGEGHRFGGAEALAARIVDAVAAQAEVVARAVAIAAPLAAKAKPAMHQLKRGMYERTLAALALPLSTVQE